jgi:hypothetical protein
VAARTCLMHRPDSLEPRQTLTNGKAAMHHFIPERRSGLTFRSMQVGWTGFDREHWSLQGTYLMSCLEQARSVSYKIISGPFERTENDFHAM